MVAREDFPEKKINISIAISPEVLKWLDQESNTEDKSRSSIINKLLRERYTKMGLIQSINLKLKTGR